MLLIGSRAVKHHCSDFRVPRDYDFIATAEEIDSFLSGRKHEILPSHPKKVRARVHVGLRQKMFEMELVDQIPSSKAIVDNNGLHKFTDPDLNYEYEIASLENLFLLKKSHICFNIHWNKNIADYLYLKSKVDESKLDLYWWHAYNLRFNEIKERVRYKERSFDVTNSDFFKASEKFVHRMLPHDNIHYATCFFEHPLFLRVKDDVTRAEMSEAKVNALSDDLKIKLIQEETMALSIERFILPAVKDKKEYNARKAYVDTAAKMVYNYLPMYLRLFAADNFLHILDLNVNYVEKFFKNVEGLALNEIAG